MEDYMEKTLMIDSHKIMYHQSFLIEEIDRALEFCWKNAHTENRNNHMLTGLTLFMYSLYRGVLSKAIQIHKKIQEADLNMLEEMPEGEEDEECKINGKDTKAGDYHLQVCNAVKEAYDSREMLLKKTIDLMRCACYKMVVEVVLEDDNCYFKNCYEDIVEEYLKCEPNAVITFKPPKDYQKE